MSKIVRVFPNADLRNGHLGLAKLARNHQSVLEDGNFLLFINRRQSAFKLFTSNLVTHYRSPRGRVMVEAIRYIPEAFNGTKFNFDKAIDLALTKALNK